MTDTDENPPISAPQESPPPTPLKPVPEARPPEPDDPLFDEFWEAYPRKVGKGEARRAWARILRRGLDTIDIIRAAERFGVDCAVRGTGKEYIPHPGKWLSAERFYDDEEVPDPVSVEVPQPSGRLNYEQVLAAVIRLAGDQGQPVTAAAAIIRTVLRNAPPDQEEFPEVSDGRARDLNEMPYPDYLLTSEWQERRRIMLLRAWHRCQVCNRVRSLHVHHRTYERRGAEQPADLIVLCDECHSLFHGKGLIPAGQDSV